VPAGDQRVRSCCDQCGAIHYENPRAVVGTIPVLGERILLCRRAIEPGYGQWTLPAGFLEIGETSAAGAWRETREEAGAEVMLGPLFSLLDVPHVAQIHLFFQAQMRNSEFSAGVESLEVALFTPASIPWHALAFTTVSTTLRWYLADCARGTFSLHTGCIGPSPSAPDLPALA
jgi:ADP-ribose pyrophosphatase YjhB (NUDIX family)